MLPWGEVQAPFTHSIELAAREHANRKNLNSQIDRTKCRILFFPRDIIYGIVDSITKRRREVCSWCFRWFECALHCERLTQNCNFYQVAHAKSIKLDVTMRSVNINSQSGMRGQGKLCENFVGVQRKSARARLANVGRVHYAVRLKRSSDQRPAQFSCI